MRKMIKHKFNAKPKQVDNKRFDSKAESKYYEKLKLLQKEGKILFFLRQVPFDLPGNVKYYVDFQEFWEDGTVIFSDVKGFETPEFIMKKKMVESLYPVEITIIKKGTL